MAYPAAPALHHNPLTVWRVENAAGEGPYDSEAATGVGPKGSAPVVDFGVRPEDTKKWWASHRGWRFGFAHKEDAVAWFGAARLKKLAEKGYRLVKKDAALIEPSTSDMQVFYLPVEKKLSGKENMLALGQGVTAEAEAEGWQRPYSRFMAAWAVADACRDDKDSWPYPKGLLSRYLKELAEFQRPGETWRQAWDRYAKPSWCKRRRTVPGYRRNPRPEPYSDVEALAELASGGYGAFDDYYEHWDVDDLDPEGLRYGRKVIWQVTPGRAVKIDPDYVVSMPENIFDPDKLAAIVDAVQSGEKPVFDVGYGTVRVIGERDVAESQEAFDRDETLTQRPLDEDDLGKLLFTVRDGNHRVFGALIAGERHVWMHLSDNDVQDVREWQRDRRAFLARFGKWADMQDARMQMLSDLLDVEERVR